MKININHPSFISFLENVTKTISTELDLTSYFKIPPSKRLKLQKAVFLLLKKSLKTRALVTDMEIKAFIIVLQKKSEETENYEISAILNDITINFDIINKPPEKKTISSVKVSE